MASARQLHNDDQMPHLRSPIATGQKPVAKANPGLKKTPQRAVFFLSDHLAAYELGVRSAYGEAFSILHFHNHTTVEMFFNLFEAVNVDDRATVHPDE